MDAFHLPRLFLAALLLLSPLESPAQARTPSLDEARAAFERYAPNTRFHDYDTSFGDFNGDGITDFVTFVGDSRYNDNGVQDLKVAAFLGARDGTFTFHEASSNILGHERVTHVLKVRQQSIFLHRDGSGGCCSHWVEEFQFKMRHGRLVLIGVEMATYHPEGITEPDYGISANLITAQAKTWSGDGKKRSEKTTAIPKLGPIPFKGFDYEKFGDISQGWPTH